MQLQGWIYITGAYLVAVQNDSSITDSLRGVLKNDYSEEDIKKELSEAKE